MNLVEAYKIEIQTESGSHEIYITQEGNSKRSLFQIMNQRGQQNEGYYSFWRDEDNSKLFINKEKIIAIHKYAPENYEADLLKKYYRI